MAVTKIGNITLDSPFLFAPLAGITDAPTRLLAREQGASLVYSEMISAKGLWYKDKNTEALLKIYEKEKPIAYQIFGSDPEIMAAAAKDLASRENALLDINMGCPVPKVVKNGEGSALLKNPDLIYRIVDAVTKTAGKPVTVKIRLGWDSASLTGLEAAKAAEAGGAAAVAVHGRTRDQYYSGKADWAAIGRIKAALRIPVIGNGDVMAGEDAIRMLEVTGCDFVMIARGALGNPWIFRDALALWKGEEKPAPPTLNEKIAMMVRHFDDLVAEKGEYAGVREMRKFAGWYLKGIHGSAALRREINSIENPENLRNLFLSIPAL